MADQSKAVSKYWQPGLGWKWADFATLLPMEIREQITAHQVYPESKILDTNSWGEMNSGIFSIKSAIKLIRDDNDIAPRQLVVFLAD